MLSRNQVKKIVIDLLVRNFGPLDPRKIKESSRLIDDLGFDSLDSVEMVMAVEEALNINIVDSQVETIITVKDMIDYIMTLNPEKTDYMKVAVRLKMIKKRNKSSLVNSFKTKHVKLFSRMRSV